jgi:hypothetical protein
VIECKRVQVERPSVSTSGGQSEREAGGSGSVEVDEEGEEDDEEEALVWDLVMAAQAAKDVQVRQLGWGFQYDRLELERARRGGERFSIFTEDDTFGQFLGLWSA